MMVWLCSVLGGQGLSDLGSTSATSTASTTSSHAKLLFDVFDLQPRCERLPADEQIPKPLRCLGGRGRQSMWLGICVSVFNNMIFINVIN